MIKFTLIFTFFFTVQLGNNFIIAQSTSWSLSGNAGIIDGINFLGTTDNNPLNFKVNNQKAGRIDPTLRNAFYGYLAGNSNTTGTYNIAIGNSTLYSNTTGSSNTATGYGALFYNNTGSYNTASGYYALYFNTTGTGNLANGANALRNNTTGSYNLAIGYASLFNNSTGSYNQAIGYAALISNTTGSYNNATGYAALYSNTSGIGNFADGAYALNINTTGSYNSAIGSLSLYNNTTGSYNNATGYGALQGNTTGFQNTANGYLALSTNKTGINNTALGYLADAASGALSNATAIGSGAIVNASNTIQLGNSAVTQVLAGTGTNATLVAGRLQITGGALGAGKVLTSDGSGVATWQNTTPSGWSLNGNPNTVDGTNFIGTTDNKPFNIRVNNSASGRIDPTLKNTFFGYQSGGFNTTGYYNSSNGYQALYSNIIGYYNTAEGGSALASNLSGNFNTANGNGALFYNTNGDHNAANGYAALATNVTGNYNTALGDYADVNGDGITNSTAIGSQTLITSSNQVRVGNSNVTSIGGYANWTNISDGRVKKNIKKNVPGLAFINKLNPVTYNLDLDAVDRITLGSTLKSTNNSVIQPSKVSTSARIAKEAIVYTGFVAQDVEKAAKSLNYDFSGVDPAKNSNDLYGLRYSDFVAPLVKAVQELSAENDSLKSQNEQQQQQINDLQGQMNLINVKLESLAKGTISSGSTILSSAKLEQNIPNPFNQTTLINYYVPETASHAFIKVAGINGNDIKTIQLNSTGSGQITLQTETLASGNYTYSLYVDGNLIDTKVMVLAR
jgi:hypothetical protein